MSCVYNNVLWNINKDAGIPGSSNIKNNIHF